MRERLLWQKVARWTNRHQIVCYYRLENLFFKIILVVKILTDPNYPWLQKVLTNFSEFAV
jgi:hypothetical protein